MPKSEELEEAVLNSVPLKLSAQLCSELVEALVCWRQTLGIENEMHVKRRF